jgi:trigger factor
VKVSTEKTEPGQIVLDIEVEPPEVEESLNKAYLRLVQRVNVPGFRRGKAPRAILERYIGKERLWEEAIEQLVPRLCQQALQEQEIEAFAQPEVEIVEREPLRFKATVPLPPLVELGDYRQIRVPPEEVEIAEEEVDSSLEQLRHQLARWVPVERPARAGDLLTLDLQEMSPGEKSWRAAGKEFPLLLDSEVYLPGFSEQLIGMEKGQEKEFRLSYPEGYEREEFAGKEYQFRVRVLEIKEKHLPELDDEFARSVGSGVETLDALREQVAARLKNRAEAEARSRLEQRVLEEVAQQSRIEFPSLLVEEEIDRILRARGADFGEGAPGIQRYLDYINKTLEEAREEIRPEATRRVVQILILDKIAAEEKIEVSQEEVDAEIARLATGAGERGKELKQMLNSPSMRSSIERRLLRQKSLMRLLEIATREEAGEEIELQEETQQEEGS